MVGALRLQIMSSSLMNSIGSGGGLKNHEPHVNLRFNRNGRSFTPLSTGKSPLLSDSGGLSSTVGFTSSSPSPQWSFTHRHIQILSFGACAAAISTTWLFCSAIPALLAFKRAAESMEKLMDVTREELPGTMASIRLSGMEISDLTMELSDLGQEITQGVRNSTRVIRVVEERLAKLTNTNLSAPMQEKTTKAMNMTKEPVVARTARGIRQGIVRVLGCSFKSFCRQRVSFRVVGVRLFGERKATAGMALVPARREYAISEVDLGIGLWTVIVHVVESHRVQHSSGNHGGRPRPYKRFLLVDQHGTKVSGVLYDKDIDYFSTSLQPFKRYRISNARLTPAFGFFRVGDYNFSWIITNDTPVELIEETHVPPLPFSYPICPFTEFFRHADKEGGFNVKAIAIHAFPQRQVTRNSTVREVVVIDESKQPMILSLWNHFGDVEGKIIADNIANTPLIIGLNMKATTFHGLALGSRPFSYILIDPPLLDTPSLKEWFALNKAEINQLLQDKAYNNTNLLLPPPSIADAIDVPTAVATLNMVNTAWVFGQVRFTAAKRAYHIVACPNCHKKVDAAAGWNLRCNSCGEYDQTELRCRVPMEITGGNQSLRIVMTSPDVEQVTGLTPQMLNDSYEFDFGMQDHLQAALDKLNVVCFIKKYDPSTLGAPSTAGLRYTVVKAYKMDTIDRPPASSPSSSAPPQLKLPNDEQQLFTPKTKKNMTELEALPTPEKTEQSAPPSKRSLDFAVAQSADASLPTHPSYASSTSTNEPTDVHTSPAKKGKEKQVSE